MRKFLKYGVGGLVLLLVLLSGGFYVWGEMSLARPTAAALAAMQSDDHVTVEEGKYLSFRPASGEPTLGVIFYPGANCDIRGYAPVFHRLANRGYLVVDVQMPRNFAIFAPDRADDVRAAWPNIRHWVIAGHSMGGAMAGYYAFHHQKDLAGLIIWDSYPPEQDSLADSDLPVWHIHRATLAGAPPEKFEEMRHLFPASSTWVPVPGGIHMYFGSFDGGGYKEQWTPKISREAQQDIVVTAMLNALQKIAASGR
ncbi:MAG: alpha/beta hydrolase [Gammaproteobacteria bacterium]|nr:alpha/beta hydrolase [Gammaproteobacteria bacterium]MCP5139859.1 alpha/beta hydrolase [Chromatiales bacterium]